MVKEHFIFPLIHRFFSDEKATITYVSIIQKNTTLFEKCALREYPLDHAQNEMLHLLRPLFNQNVMNIFIVID
jgi:hypothetical protein